HHTLGVGTLSVATDRDVAIEPRRELHELGGRSRVQTEPVLHFERFPRDAHGRAPPPALPSFGESVPLRLSSRVTRSTSRCTTSMRVPSRSLSRRASSTAITTERWRPPVQPMPTVR